MLLLAALLYIPTLRTGFLTDDFLDSECTMSKAPEAFTSMVSTGYRPLMSFSWAIDNMLWGRTNQAGWHFTNIIILLATLFLLHRFLSLYIQSSTAISVGLLLFALSLPVALSVAKVVWRTSLLPMIPLLGAFILAHKWGSDSGKWWHLASTLFLFLISLFLKELALASPPVFAAIVFTSAGKRNEWKKPLSALILTGAAVILYALTRFLAVGFSTGYSDSFSIGFFMVKNIFVFSSITWAPWFSSIPVRIYMVFYILFLWVVPGNWKIRLLIVFMTVFMLLPVSNLTFRPDYAVAGVPSISLAIGLLVQKLEKRRFTLPVLFVLFLGIFLHSRDQLRIVQDASDYVRETTGRIAEISDGIPGTGPLFVSGVVNSVGVYGTFWPGEYMLPMQCQGIQPDRMITGTDRIWEILLEEGDSGYLVFLSNDCESCFTSLVSLDDYTELPDSTVVLSGAVPAGDLLLYPSCSASDESSTLVLVSSIYRDSVITITPEVIDGKAVFDLASVPEWLAADDNTVLVVPYRTELTFFSENIALKKAQTVIASKSEFSFV